MMSIHKPYFYATGAGVAPFQDRGMVRGCSAAVGDESYTPEVGGTEHAAYYSSSNDYQA